MKTNNFTIIALLVFSSLFVWSCKKDHKEPDGIAKTYKLTINVGADGFTQSVTTATNNNSRLLATAVSDSASLANAVNKLYFYVFDSNNKVVYSATQANTAKGFGTINTVIVPGNYKLAVFGCKTGIDDYTLASSYEATPGWDYEYNSYTSTPWPDCFYYSAPLVIASSDLNRSVTLSRMVSQVQVVIKDAIPASVKTIKLYVSNNEPLFDIRNNAMVPINGTDLGTSVSSAITTAMAGTTDFTLSADVINGSNSFNAEIDCYDGSNQIVASRRFDPITLAPDQQVIYSIASMFGGVSSNSSFQVSVNTGWKTTVVHQTF